MSLFKRAIAIITAFFMTIGFIQPWMITDRSIKDVPECTPNAVRVISFNLHYDDNTAYGKIKNRSVLVSKTLKKYQPDSFGVQEATEKWLTYLDKYLGDQYARVGETRDSSAKDTEANCVFYLKEKYDLLDSGTIWLSETPDVPGSVSFSSSLPRIASWATLKDKQTGLTYTHINTHLDNTSDWAREKQAEVLMQKINFLSQTAPVVCTGDFNGSQDSDANRIMEKNMDNASVVAAETDSGITYHDYGNPNANIGTLDYIFVEKGTSVARYKIIDNMIKNMFLSDHYGICADIFIKNN